MNSNFFKLNLQDLFRGFIVAFITALLTGVMPVLESGTLPTLEILKTCAITGLTAGVAYILKNLFTNSNNQLLKKELL